MRFLHLADVHLDTPFSGRSEEIRDRLRRASRTAFSRAVDVALAESVDVVLVAGDLFDGPRLSFQTERFLLGEMERLDAEGIPVVYATGNHDPGRVDRRARHLEYPGNVTVISSRDPVTVPIRDDSGRVVARVTGVGHETDREGEDLSSLLRLPRRGAEASGQPVPEIALLHALVVGSRRADAHDRYAPASLDALRSSGYGYWALGHVHLRQTLGEDPHVVYPGNPQGRHPGEAGPKGALVVEMTPTGGVQVEFHELGPIRWETLAVGDLSEARTLDALESEIRARWDRARSGDPGGPGTEWMVRVVPTGSTPLWKELGNETDLMLLAGELAPLLGALDVEVRPRGVHPVVDPREHVERQDVIGETLRLLEDVRNGAADLLGPGGSPSEELAAAITDASDVGRYVRELLDGAEGELLARMLRGVGSAGGTDGGEH